jgi:pseudaminic acid synthase
MAFNDFKSKLSVSSVLSVVKKTMPEQQPEIKPVKIGNHLVGPGHPVFIVAELSANHRQDLDEAVRLIHAAKEAGADAVKLQTYTPDTMTIDCDGENFLHGNGSLWEGKTLYELYKDAYMPWKWQPELKKIASDMDLDLFSSAYDPTSVDFLEAINLPAIKISSFELIDLPLIRCAANTGIPLILSTGMATLPEIDQAVAAAREAGCTELILLKCTSAYPTLPEGMNLKGIVHLLQTYHVPCGLSDHTTDTAAAGIATALGACVIEKHLTLSRLNKSADSGFSLEPSEFKEMVNSVRKVEKMIGNTVFEPVVQEHESLSFRRSLYAVAEIERGERVTAEKIRSIRPGGGLPPEHLKLLMAKRARKKISKGTPITMDLFT